MAIEPVEGIGNTAVFRASNICVCGAYIHVTLANLATRVITFFLMVCILLARWFVCMTCRYLALARVLTNSLQFLNLLLP